MKEQNVDKICLNNIICREKFAQERGKKGFIFFRLICLVLVELLATLASLGDVLEDVVADGLGERAALTDDDLITDLGLEGGGAVDGEVLVALHVTLVLLDVVEVVATDDDGLVGLGGVDDATHEAAADGDVAGEGALLVDVLAVDGGLGGLEAKTDGLPVAETAAVVDVLLGLLAGVLVDTGLLLVGTLGLEGDVEVTSLEVLLLGLLDHFFFVKERVEFYFLLKERKLKLKKTL